jgi:branched-chain amino acid transport system permease protein
VRLGHLPALAAALLLLVGLAACAFVDSDQARICRSILPALHPDGTAIAVKSVAAGRESNSLRIVYARPGRNGAVTQSVVCSFAGGRFSRERQVLAGLVADGEPFGEVRLHILRRYWLDEPSTALLAPPPSPEELEHLPEIARGTAVVLQHVAAALPKIAIYALLAPAYALIYGLIGRINLAFGELAVIGGQGALIGAIGGAMAGEGAPALILLGSLLIALAAAATHGEFMARAVFLPLSGKSGQAILVASIGLAVAFMEYVRLAQGSGNRWTPPLLNTPVPLARAGDFVVTATEGAMATVALSLGAGLALLAAMRRSGFGRDWRAVADDAGAAALLGVDAGRVLMRAFALASLLAGLSGFIMTAHYGGIGFSGGLATGLKALIGAIAGGVGSVPGAMLGAVAIGTFEAAWSAALPLEHADIAVYAILVTLLVFRPGGLLGWGEGAPRRV